MMNDKPVAYVILTGLTVVLVAALAAQCGCCLHPTSYPRDTLLQYDESVALHVTCMDVTDGSFSGWFGSGVIVGAHEIFTAAHVAAQPPGQICIWEGITRSGIEFNAIPSHVKDDLDLASMISDRDLPYTPVFYGNVPELGDTVCAAPAYPKREHVCGEVQPRKEPPGDLDTSMIVEPGNSGGGVYDVNGSLIGIVVHMTFCSNYQICGSHVSTLAGHIQDLL